MLLKDTASVSFLGQMLVADIRARRERDRQLTFRLSFGSSYPPSAY
jgi:hypothetical protein